MRYLIYVTQLFSIFSTLFRPLTELPKNSSAGDNLAQKRLNKIIIVDNNLFVVMNRTTFERFVRVGQGFCVFGIQGRFKSGIRYIAA